MPDTLSKCPKCDGCGKLDDREQKPWSRFLGHNVPEIHTGEIQVIYCPDCKGTGQVALKPTTTPERAADERPIAADQPAES